MPANKDFESHQEQKRKEDTGEMTVREAGHRGGEKGGERTAETHGHQFYEEIGKKGGQKVRELIEKGKKLEGKD
ncbi:MAG TPA: Em GEA1 (EM1) [Armatimonadota bacterium]|jgi:general stress protein YciG|nr:Em GEA1 (EM1) [Armatimonadota bacterium]